MPDAWQSRPVAWVGLVLLALLVRLMAGYAGYSGAANPPKYGDYEAQRHWMEVTLHYPPSQWYTDTRDNNVTWWPLDYPPLSGVQVGFWHLTALGVVALLWCLTPRSAPQSWIHGQLVRAVEPAAVQLWTSRGYESRRSKAAMRWTVLLSDMAVYIPASLLAAQVFKGRSSSSSSSKAGLGPSALFIAAAMLLQPALLLIDHSHFQYNGISLGLSAAAAAAIAADCQLLGSVLYCLALNHKQMSLFYAPAFFGHLLGRSLQQPTVATKVAAVAKLGITVIATFGVCWYPYLTSLDAVLQVVGRIFPVRRGLFEDYLANWWCVTSLVIKWKTLASNELLMKVCAAATLLAAAPSMVQQIRAPSSTGLLLAMANSGYAFFMFSYQVHEKSILLPLLPVTMLAASEPDSALWVPLVAAFSMYPLLERDGAPGVYLATNAIYLLLMPALAATQQGGAKAGRGHGHAPQAWRRWLLWGLAGVAAACHGLRWLPPPERLPWLWDRIHVSAAFVPLAAHMAYLHWRQYSQGATADGRTAKRKVS